MNLTKTWLTEKSTIVTDTRLKWRKAWCPPGWSRATYPSKSCHPTSWPQLRWSTWPGDPGTHVQASTTMSLRLGLHNFVTNTWIYHFDQWYFCRVSSKWQMAFVELFENRPEIYSRLSRSCTSLKGRTLTLSGCFGKREECMDLIGIT